METIRFWYTFEDEDKDSEIPTEDVEITISNESGIKLPDVCDAFARFIESIGYSTENLVENFLD